MGNLCYKDYTYRENYNETNKIVKPDDIQHGRLSKSISTSKNLNTISTFYTNSYKISESDSLINNLDSIKPSVSDRYLSTKLESPCPSSSVVKQQFPIDPAKNYKIPQTNQNLQPYKPVIQPILNSKNISALDRYVSTKLESPFPPSPIVKQQLPIDPVSAYKFHQANQNLQPYKPVAQPALNSNILKTKKINESESLKMVIPSKTCIENPLPKNSPVPISINAKVTNAFIKNSNASSNIKVSKDVKSRLGNQEKKVYKSKEDFKMTFDYLIRLEELEELKPVYENEASFRFINNEDISQLIERLFIFKDLKSVNTLKEIEKKLKKMKNLQRKFAIFSDYKCLITDESIDKIVVKCNKGENYETEIKIFNEYCLFEFKEEVPNSVNSFNIIIEESNYDRIKMALKSYLTYGVNEMVNLVFLGQVKKTKLNFEVDVEDYSAERMLELNGSQRKAVKNALNYYVSIIQGPPGTGKTQTISSIVYNIDYLCRKRVVDHYHNYCYDDSYGCDYDYCNDDISAYFTKSSKILICAASNNPVFDLRRKLVKLGINVVHVLARSKEDQYSNDPNTLSYILKKRLRNDKNYTKLVSELKQLKTLNLSNPEILKIEKKIIWMRMNIEKTILAEANVICCTTRVLPNGIFKDFSFDFVIIDEATQCIEPDVVFCLLKDVKHLILVGDIHQLGPVIKSQEAKELGLGISTIERLQKLGVPLSFLDTQYRMYPFLSGFSNINIYENKIKNGKTGEGPLIFPKIVKTCGFFYHILSNESTHLSSYINIDEATAVINIVIYLRSKNIKFEDIGVITFYSSQRQHLRELAKKKFLTNLEVMSVDESQGREKEYIILSCVRSNKICKVGFLNEYRRLNVAMTRAKSGLIVCGNANNFRKSELWLKLVKYFHERNSIFTGNLNSLKIFNPRVN